MSVSIYNKTKLKVNINGVKGLAEKDDILLNVRKIKNGCYIIMISTLYSYNLEYSMTDENNIMELCFAEKNDEHYDDCFYLNLDKFDGIIICDMKKSCGNIILLENDLYNKLSEFEK